MSSANETILRNDVGRALSLACIPGEPDRHILYCGDRLDSHGLVGFFVEGGNDEDDEPDSYGGSALFDDTLCLAGEDTDEATPCSSCVRALRGQRRGDILRRMFPSLDAEAASKGVRNADDVAAVVSGALRSSGGSLDKAASLLVARGAAKVNPPSHAFPFYVIEEEVAYLAKTLDLTDLDVARAALRFCADLERAAAWIADDPSAVDVAAENEREGTKARQKAATAPVPDTVWQMGRWRGLHKIPVQAADGATPDRPPEVMVVDGHRMVFFAASLSHECGSTKEVKKEVGPHCVLCADKLGGAYQCELCQLCEGCIRSGEVVSWCPALLNGGQLHRHALVYKFDPDGVCVVRGRGNSEESGIEEEGEECCERGSGTAWFCRKSSCNFRVCAACVRRPPPSSRPPLCGLATDKVQDTPEGAKHPSDAGDTVAVTDDNLDRTGRDTSDGDSPEHRAAERAVATRWEYRGTGPVRGAVIVGTGEIGRTNPPDAEVVDYVSSRRTRNNATLGVSGRLPDEAKDALESFLYKTSMKHSRPGESHFSGVAAADISHVEDLLHRAVGMDDRLTERALRDALANGRLGVAGTLLLSQTYAPRAIAKKSDGADDDEAAADAMCWCGDVIDSTTAPDGAVGCLGGHAMHPSCAADLLLSGGSCPSCRQPLYFPKIPGQEARAALDLAVAETQRSQEEKEERISGLATGDLNTGASELLAKPGVYVRISSSAELCEKVQMEDPRTGGWVGDMADSCGKVGLVVTSDDMFSFGKTHHAVASTLGGKELVPVWVLTCKQHTLTPIKPESFCSRYRCCRCKFEGPSPETGRRKCSCCFVCEMCCHKLPARSCGGPGSTQQRWAWHPSLLQPISLGENDKVDFAKAAANAAEHHLTLLRAELKAITAAREAIKASLEEVKPSPFGRELSTNSSAAVRDLLGKVSPTDWERGRHLLLLARRWGDSDAARATRVRLCDAVRRGELDTVARIVRRYNAYRTAETIVWADAVAGQSEYIVVPTAKVDLFAFPTMSSPKTGYSLEPGSHFTSQKEIMDKKGNLWLLVNDSDFPDPRIFKLGGTVDVSKLGSLKKNALIGARVQRGPGWNRGAEDGGEGNEGTIVSLGDSNAVFVKWDLNSEQYEYSINTGGIALEEAFLVFAAGPAPPPQGWLCVRPGGPNTPSVVMRARSPLRCFSCGDGLIAPTLGQERFSTVKGQKIQKGDRLIVAATLEPVFVESCTDEQIFCSFPRSPSASPDDGGEVGLESPTFWYRPSDLIFPQGMACASADVDEQLIVNGRLRTRREVVLLCGGDEVAARLLWSEALKERKAKSKGTDEMDEDDDEAVSFASCARGHLLHARCLQGALLAGRCCPAPGCTEPLWVPRVRQQRTEEEDACCGGENNTGETQAVAEALRTANELAGHAELVSARHADRREEVPFSSAGLGDMKMCPICCAGPLFNNNCSDMQTHHGECSAYSFGSTHESCTPQGTFRASASDIAERLMRVSATTTVADVLPQCPKHKVLVIFNGCLSCGHLFTDTSWNDLPKYDPKAMALLELDKKRRKAAESLATQIRSEAAMLQFDRDTLWNIRNPTHANEGSTRVGSGDEQNILDHLPPLPPPAHKYRLQQCGPGCTLAHYTHGDCVMCGRSWNDHSGHTCWEGGRGSWVLNDESQARQMDHDGGGADWEGAGAGAAEFW